MVSVAGVKLAAKHVQLHNCSAMGKPPTDLSGFGLARDEAKTLKLPTETKSDQFA